MITNMSPTKKIKQIALSLKYNRLIKFQLKDNEQEDNS